MTRIISLLLVLLVAEGFAQGNSPLSQVGVGLTQNEYFQSSFGINQGNDGYASPNFLNPSNPASYSKLDFTIGEVGVIYSSNQIFSGTHSTSQNAFSLGNFGFGFPVRNGGIGLGLQPYAQKDYSYSFSSTDLNGEEIIRRFNGDGNVSQLFLGGSYQFGQLSLGMNANYKFGELRDAEQIEFINSDLTNVRRQDFVLVRAVDLKFGVQYQLKLNEEEQLMISGTYKTSSLINNSSEYQIINNYSTGYLVDNGDSIFVENHSGGLELLNNSDQPTDTELSLPFEYSAGLAYTKGNKIYLGLNYKNVAWNSFRFKGNNGGLLRSQRLSVGMQIIPNENAKGTENYWKTIVYRAGLSFGTTPYQWNGTQLNQTGIKVGIGFPLTRYKYETERFGSYCFASFGYDRIFNSSIGSAYAENLFKINFAIILNDKWFIQRKFD